MYSKPYKKLFLLDFSGATFAAHLELDIEDDKDAIHVDDIKGDIKYKDDTETEVVIQKALKELSKGRATLIIAHRLATIKNADCIIVVTEHGIVEQGNHKELMDMDGVYGCIHNA